MSYPIDQFAALARANFDLALKLADIARTSGQETVQFGSKTLSGFADDARATFAHTTGGDGGGTPEGAAGKAAALSDIAKIRDHAIADTQAAFDAWRRALLDVAATAEAAPGEALANVFKPWFAQGAAPAATIG